jgi:DNA-directed RNA polymerase subunit RPC12/RpoP
MGHAYNYRCQRCGFEQDFNQGHGFLIHSQHLNDYLKQGKKLFHYKTHQLLKSLAEQSDNLYLKAGFQIYKCPKCKILQDKTEVTVFREEEVIHKSEFRCKHCRSRLKLTNIHRLKKAICPACKNRTFQMNHISNELWD